MATKRFQSRTGTGVNVCATDQFGAEHRVRIEGEEVFSTDDEGLITVLENTPALESAKSAEKTEAKPEPKKDPEPKAEEKPAKKDGK